MGSKTHLLVSGSPPFRPQLTRGDNYNVYLSVPLIQLLLGAGPCLPLCPLHHLSALPAGSPRLLAAQLNARPPGQPTPTEVSNLRTTDTQRICLKASPGDRRETLVQDRGQGTEIKIISIITGNIYWHLHHGRQFMFIITHNAQSPSLMFLQSGCKA